MTNEHQNCARFGIPCGQGCPIATANKIIKPKLPPKPVDLIFPAARKFRDENRCPFCRQVINPNGFKDELSRREFEINGLCQGCQDGVFTDPEDNTTVCEGDTHWDP